MQFEIKLLQS